MSEGFRRARGKGKSDAGSLQIIPIVDHYGGEVREGRNVSVRCFLHPDKRRSAVIDTINQVFYCHTCAQGGNAINIVMIKEGVDKRDAYKIATGIIERAGLTLPRGAAGKSRGNSVSRRTWTI